MARVKEVIAKVEPHDSPERFRKLGVDCISGTASFVSPWELEVVHSDGHTERLTARSIVVATGGKPAVPPIPGLADMEPLTSDNLWSLQTQPERLLVLGGGPIGSELAHAFARLGSKVIQVEMGERLLAKEDADVSEVIRKQFEQDGIDLRLNHAAKEFAVEDGEKVAYCEFNGERVRIVFDQVLVAVGRAARTDGLGLEKIGVETLPNGTVPVAEDMSMRFPNVFACGDVAGPYQFTHAAAHQAWYAAVNGLFGEFKRFQVDYFGCRCLILRFYNEQQPTNGQDNLSARKSRQKNHK
jgi:pyruvate/2-oxoglutarate dehydrogenase complex dihydrolipoamide dehydrogenase (E3) component